VLRLHRGWYDAAMKQVAVVVVMLGACGSTPPPEAPKNDVPVAELRCKTAVERAGAAVKLRAKDVTMTIGVCEQEEWTRPARECVAAAKADDDLVKCGTEFNLGDKKGIFSEHSFAKAMKAMERFGDEMCACKDTACAQKVSDEMTKWSQEEAKDQKESPKMTEDDIKRATAIGERMGKCMQTAMGMGTSGNP
jgi:hypothetical protein